MPGIWHTGSVYFTIMQPSDQLVAALAAIKNLGGEDFSAIASWMKGEGRKALRDRGATDNAIGGMRLDTDRLGDAPLG
ncbi:MAG: hypothetical protein JWO85_1527 [Candidatus Eremiobacteraeota bacterium]|nr:hypothetical protein [Candidatus Eremiobacteraeota bacterium]